MPTIEEIRTRWAAASPAPWFWRGNTDREDPSLACRRPHVPGKQLGGVTEVLSHVRHQLTREDAIRAGLLEAEIDMQDWHVRQVIRHGAPIEEGDPEYDRLYQAEYTRRQENLIADWLTDDYGEPRVERRLSFTSPDGVPWLIEARDLAVYQVCPQATGRSDPRVCRADIVGINHPDAVAIEHAAGDVAYLLNRLAQAERCIQRVSTAVASTGGHRLRDEIEANLTAYRIRTKET